MAVSIEFKRERNIKITEFLKENRIEVQETKNKEDLKNENWFLPTRKGKPMLKLRTKNY